MQKEVIQETTELMKMNLEEIKEIEAQLAIGFSSSNAHKEAKTRLGILKNSMQHSRDRKREMLTKIAFEGITTVYTTGSPTQEFEEPEDI